MSASRSGPDATTPPTDPALDRELRAVSALLRGLADPAPPGRLADRVMAEVARREARPRVIQLFERRPAPGMATALAAGLSCLLVFGAVEGEWLSLPQGPAPRIQAAAPLVPSAARRVATAADVGAERPGRPVVPPFASATVIDPRVAAYIATAAAEVLPGRVEAGPALRTSLVEERLLDQRSLDGRLDRQLNHLLLDPTSFYHRIERVHDPERFVDRLAERAARRGDAPGIALRLRLRAPEHPQTGPLVERFLRAALDRHLAGR